MEPAWRERLRPRVALTAVSAFLLALAACRGTESTAPAATPPPSVSSTPSASSNASADSGGVPPVQFDLARGAGESAVAFAARLLPAGVEPAYAPTELVDAFQGRRIVVLFRARGSTSNYTGWVLVPAAAGDEPRYRRTTLPPMDEVAGLFEVNVTGVFALPARLAPGAIVVLYRAYRSGSGEPPTRGGYLFRWDGAAYVTDEEASNRLAGARSEADARARLEP